LRTPFSTWRRRRRRRRGGEEERRRRTVDSTPSLYYLSRTILINPHNPNNPTFPVSG